MKYIGKIDCILCSLSIYIYYCTIVYICLKIISNRGRRVRPLSWTFFVLPPIHTFDTLQHQSIMFSTLDHSTTSAIFKNSFNRLKTCILRFVDGRHIYFYILVWKQSNSAILIHCIGWRKNHHTVTGNKLYYTNV
jgi:hypothetical protein